MVIVRLITTQRTTGCYKSLKLAKLAIYVVLLMSICYCISVVFLIRSPDIIEIKIHVDIYLSSL